VEVPLACDTYPGASDSNKAEDEGLAREFAAHGLIRLGQRYREAGWPTAAKTYDEVAPSDIDTSTAMRCGALPPRLAGSRRLDKLLCDGAITPRWRAAVEYRATVERAFGTLLGSNIDRIGTGRRPDTPVGPRQYARQIGFARAGELDRIEHDHLRHSRGWERVRESSAHPQLSFELIGLRCLSRHCRLLLLQYCFRSPAQ